jgi:hypothetical protein
MEAHASCGSSQEQEMDTDIFGYSHTNSTTPYVTEQPRMLYDVWKINCPVSMDSLSLDSHEINSTLWSNSLQSFSAVGGNG